MTLSVLTNPVFPLDFLSKRGLHIVPHPDRVLIVKLPKERLEKNFEGVIIIPDTAGRRTMVRNNWGQVLAIGSNVKSLEAGDVVHWGDHAGMIGEVKKAGDFDAHVDISESSDWHSFKETLPQDRCFCFLDEKECDIIIDLEDGEELPDLHES